MQRSTFLLSVLFLVLCSCTDHVEQIPVAPAPTALYEVALDSTIHTYIEQYITKVEPKELEEKEAVIVVDWMAIFGGQCVFISLSRNHPKTYQHYPQFWARHRGYLVFVYDSKYNNQLVNPQALHQEIDRILQQDQMKMETRVVPDLIYEPVPWRITEREGKVQIDTSNVFLKVR